ncbi:SPT3 Dosage dependent suppressor of Ty-induced promoter mutations-like protein [Yamadazyma tenuis]|uniref:IPT/TIG domain-containing protein n=1 Tax=Candida tenuis (strain ATCC 10573 / BCRC 21748 / CBS 615 / JCM 9827 / NBRC 10315 / NRRL Y-1498 / VKM Y-70) TaxID=590646 RepID=G3B9T3_CANTC|nr:uncharacterized protein CANTEDRAFT_125360 [Yamadazyma tenuis ATCC 10573]EGV61964.1 hypothetical protein CANTEDRAFT_125360 [Yamadazyma tenuis ATCC 10573]WEJ93211.1 SPT3 Dosage dependent suppressor of Ty-induced promoter mutations-like protein [Yamadazyma tenuis]
MAFSFADDSLLNSKFFEGDISSSNNVNQSDDILDEFLDQRVYDNVGLSPDKSEFFEFYENSPSVIAVHQGQGTVSNHNYNESLSPMNEGDGGEVHSVLSNVSSHVNVEHLNHLSETNSTPNLNSHTNNNNNSFFDSLNPSPSMSTGLSSDNGDMSQYELLRNQVSKLKFGKYEMKVTPDSIEPTVDLLDFSPEAMSKLPYSLSLLGLPDYSRVETQIKINFNMNPPPPQNLLHIPQDLVSKNKFCLSDELSSLSPIILKNLLYLDCFVLTSDMTKSCNVCPKCIKREQKRASRRRLGIDDAPELPRISPHGIVKNNPSAWLDDKMLKKAIMFNCKEIVSFPAPNSLNNNKALELSARIICYCRHHQESEGFKLLFVVRNYEGDVLAKSVSSNIMIMDRKKPMSGGISHRSSSSITGYANESSSSFTKPLTQKNPTSPGIKSEPRTDEDLKHPISPNSIDESSDLTTNESERNLKRKKLSIDDSNNSTNPMYNGSVNGFSPVSNSDTNTSINNHQLNKNVYQRTPSRIPDNINSNLTTLPTILRIIPAEGPIRGGIEVTLLGFNFNSNLGVKFGANSALATHCWSETTIVTYLPPAAQPGQVLVSFENHENLLTNQQQQIFTYTDDTDKQLIELALQIVGLKMNGKLEDAKNIAKRIVGNDNSNNISSSNSNVNSAGISPSVTNNSGALEWYNNAQGIVEKLTQMNYSTEEILVNFLKLVELPNCPIIIPNWQLANNEGQTLLHLSTLKNYTMLVKFLTNHGCKIDLQDNQGLTPLFYASINGQRELIDLFINCKANPHLRLSNDKTIKDYCDLNVMDMFSDIENGMEDGSSINEGLQKSYSMDSLNSMFEMKGLHVSKMVPERLEDDSEFADSEYSGDCDVSDYNDDVSNYDDDISEVNDDLGIQASNSNIPTISYIVESESEDAKTIKDGTSEGNDTDRPPSPEPSSGAGGIWQKVKNVFNNSDDDLPNYDDLFPFGPSVGPFRPKSTIERLLNNQQDKEIEVQQESSSTSIKEAEIETKEDLSDSSEDMIISYINHPRKTVENDKMLIFFWVPVLLIIVSLFISVSVIGYEFEPIDNFKQLIREGLGNLMVGNERIKRVFSDSVRR